MSNNSRLPHRRSCKRSGLRVSVGLERVNSTRMCVPITIYESKKEESSNCKAADEYLCLRLAIAPHLPCTQRHRHGNVYTCKQWLTGGPNCAMVCRWSLWHQRRRAWALLSLVLVERRATLRSLIWIWTLRLAGLGERSMAVDAGPLYSNFSRRLDQ